ncbi:enoyl-CoA hydratase-related protein [Polaromonas hydrogenivorans]|uniref:Enoyl-CoA hydratase-related protein n=1 Tax=Polaromonas hydrogenivorans TaxID=335476 RepID=A0AAU7LZZ0_9BURK
MSNISNPLHVLAEVRSQVLWLTINRESSRNALNDAVLETMASHIRQSFQDRALRAIVITGAGNRVFCAGGDLKSDSATFEFDYSKPSTSYADLMRAAFDAQVPLIARINGHCLAGGMGLLAMCDMAVSTEQAKFGLPEVKIGMFPMQVAATLRRIIPARIFAELCYTGANIDAQQALDIGLLNYVVAEAELDSKLASLLQTIAANSPTAIRRGKYALRATQDMTIDQALAYMETQLGTLSLTKDAQEGIASFNEKRSAQWSGR